MNDESAKSKVIPILKDMLDEKKHVILGCIELSALWHEGHDFIDYDFLEHYDNMQHIPMPDQYHLWNQEVLKDRIKDLEIYKSKVLRDVKTFLDKLLTDGK